MPDSITATFSAPPASSIRSLAAASILHALVDPDSVPHSQLPAIHPTLLSAVNADPSCKARLFLSAALTPYFGITYLDRKGKRLPAVELVIRESLKLGVQNHYLDGIPPLFAAAELLNDPTLGTGRFKVPSERVAIGSWFLHISSQVSRL
jgi:tRNA nucleotidyltransferase (CCA-adding enzyme)